MPREREMFTRLTKTRNVEKIYILSYEGNLTEPQYFEALKEELKYKNFKLYIYSVKRESDDTNSSPRAVFNALKTVKSQYLLKETDEFWMIIDRDRWVLDEWVEKCKKEKNFYLSITNPCFEFWLLLHIVDLNSINDDQKEKILKNPKVSRKKRFLDKLLESLLAEGYNKTNIRPTRFLSRKEFAIKQAENLNDDILSNLGSHNYILVKKLIE